MMHRADTIRSTIAALAGAALVALAPAASAQVPCGGEVPPGETVTLTADVGPCDGGSGAIFVGGVLDLGGHTVSCADTNGDGELPDGIVLIGKKAVVRNGTVSGCLYDVYIGVNGRHLVENVVSTNAAVYGFYVDSRSKKNRIVGSTATGNADDGFQIRGTKNVVEGSLSENNGEDGFDLTQAVGNRLTGNTSRGNQDDGFEATGKKNKILGNTSTGNGDNGIAVGDRGNKVIGNTVTGNGDQDILGADPCKGNKFKGNTFGTGSSCVK